MNEQHYNHLLPSWNHRAQANVQIEPLFLFPRTSSNVHACAMWFYSSSYWRSASKVEEKSWSKKFSLFWSFFVSRFPSLYFPLQFVFVSCNEKILISITQQKKATPKNNWNNLLLAAGGKFDCSRRTTEGNWQLLNQSCDDDFVMKWKKKFQPRLFSSRARGHSRKNNKKLLLRILFCSDFYFSSFDWAWSESERTKNKKKRFAKSYSTWGRLACLWNQIKREENCILPRRSLPMSLRSLSSKLFLRAIWVLCWLGS